SLGVAAVEARLDELSARLTALLRKWWTDPPGLSVHVKLLGNEDGKARQHRINSWGFSCQIVDAAGLQCQGEGLLWFLTFLINVELLRACPGPMYLLLDEPAAPVHPSAQRMVAKLIDSLSVTNQVIYSTHSPFLI